MELLLLSTDRVPSKSHMTVSTVQPPEERNTQNEEVVRTSTIVGEPIRRSYWCLLAEAINRGME